MKENNIKTPHQYLLLRSLIFTFLQYLSSIPFFFLALTFVLMPHRYRYYVVTRWSILVIHLLKWCCNIDYDVKGLENLPEQKGVVLCKHQSAWETLFLQKLLGVQTWVIKRELCFIPFFGWGLYLLQPIAINRKDKSVITQLIEQGKKYLKLGRWVIIFPEGTRVKYGEVGHYTRSGARLAIEAKAPIIPMAHNAGLYWPKNKLMKYPGTIKLVIGKPIYPTENDTAEELTSRAKDWIESTVKTL